VLVITRGFRNALRIAYQNRPRLFDRHIVLPELLYARVIEADERMTAQGDVLRPLDEGALREQLQAAFDAGLRSCAVVLMHGYRHVAHEQAEMPPRLPVRSQAESVRVRAEFGSVSASGFAGFRESESPVESRAEAMREHVR